MKRTLNCQAMYILILVELLKNYYTTYHKEQPDQYSIGYSRNEIKQYSSLYISICTAYCK